MSHPTADLIFDAKAELAEGPVWHEGALWWVNINAGTLNQLNTNTLVNHCRATGHALGAAVPASDGHWLIGGRSKVSRFDWRTGKITSLATLTGDLRHVRFNDGKCDPRGRFFIGTMHPTGRAALYRLERDQLRQQFSGVTISNGLDWSPDGTRFYYTDTATRRLDVFDYDVATGTMQNRRPLVAIPAKRGSPDGLCCDRNGNIWLALWGGGSVECLDGRTGKSLERISVPARQVSSCCFGGEENDCLLITSAWEGYDAAARESDPLAGGIFLAKPGVCGQVPTLAQSQFPIP